MSVFMTVAVCTAAALASPNTVPCELVSKVEVVDQNGDGVADIQDCGIVIGRFEASGSPAAYFADYGKWPGGEVQAYCGGGVWQLPAGAPA